MFAVKYIALFVYLIKSVSSDLHIETSSGPIQGVSSSSGDVEVFLGIPFAEPPVGDLRFAKPVPKKPWTEILNASNFAPPCSQISMGDFYYTPYIGNMSEDCLYLNIWTPKPISSDALKPVIIFIHGGSFTIGGTNFSAHGGTKLAGRGDVVVVTITYRLGAFGFLWGNIEEASGNMGMYDQVMAIKWVKTNALAFGGDPENIVLMGESAGAVSVSLHVISPISKPLFHKAIIESGSGLNPLIYDNGTGIFANSESLASFTGCANETVNLRTNPYDVIDCLKRQPVGTIITAMEKIHKTEALMFLPRVGDEFLPRSPAELLLSDSNFRTDIPVLTGITSDEGTIFLTSVLTEQFGVYGEKTSQRINKHFSAFMARTILRMLKVSNATAALHYYMSTVGNKTAVEYAKMIASIFGDYLITCGTIFQADFLSTKGSPVYFYMFAARSRATPFAEWMGTTHMEELQYVFGNSYHEQFTDEDVKLSNYIMDRWATFAKTGDPNIPGHLPWLQYSHKSPKYLRIEHEDEMIHMDPMERCKIWRTRFKAVID